MTENQDERYQRLIDEEREELERVFTDTMERVVKKNLIENSHDGLSVSEVPEDLTFKLEPQESESPILSLDTETIEKIRTWAAAYNDIRGDIPADMFADKRKLGELILQLPEDAIPDEDELEDAIDEQDPAVRQAAEDMGIMDSVDGSGEGESESDGEDVELTPPGISSDD